MKHLNSLLAIVGLILLIFIITEPQQATTQQVVTQQVVTQQVVTQQAATQQVENLTDESELASIEEEPQAEDLANDEVSHRLHI
ncbi:MAG TPA: hypothetical protein ACN46O_09095 [Prochlorococcus sp.]|jgi:hypothetical protein|tara:strand:- start:188 stop:439 length:252 start_codon:yes stop_codon:yes gene_type:complete